MSEKKRKIRVVIAGQVPPPIGGQNLNIALMLKLMRRQEEFEVDHWVFQFTPQWKVGRQRSWRKVVELFLVIIRLIMLRMRGPIDLLLYPSGGPHFAPVVRDIVLLRPATWLARRVTVNFQAAGIANALPEHSPFIQNQLRSAYAGCYSAFTLSSYGKADPEALGIERIDVLPMAVADLAAPVAPSGGNPDVPVFFNAGHLCADKGIPQLLVAVRQALDAGAPSFRLRLAGECIPPYSQEQMDEDIRRLQLEGVVEHVGLLKGRDLDDAYAKCDVFIFSTVAPYESFGMVLVEAMRQGLPLLLTDWRANAEVAGPDFGGVLVPSGPDLSAELAKGLQACMDQRGQWETWGRKNRRRYEEAYQISCLEENLSALIKKRAAPV